MSLDISQLLKDETDINASDLGDLGKAAEDLVAKQLEIEGAEHALKRLKAEERRISQEVIPALMDNIGLAKITLNTGNVIEVKDAVQCSIPVSNRDRAYEWMVEHGHGDLIKTALTAKFGRGEKDDAAAAAEVLHKIGIHASLAESVHPGTLKAWARQEIEGGRMPPSDLFNVHVVRLTKVT